jgi:hypothetical protein
VSRLNIRQSGTAPLPPASARAAWVLALLGALTGSCSWASPVHAASPKRPLPDYDGRKPPPTTPGDVLLWVPRVLLFPPYLVAEYLIRKPLGWVISTAEREEVPSWLYDFFTFGSEHQAGVVPTAYVDFDFYPSIGLYSFWNDALFSGHDLRLRVSFGGSEWRSASFSERFHFTRAERGRLALEAAVVRRPDFAFFGIGPDTRQSELVRYGLEALQLRANVEQQLWRVSAFRAQVSLRSVEFRRGGYEGDRVLEDAVAAGDLALPPGYDDPYTLFRTELSGAWDNRLPRPGTGSGIRLGGHAEHSSLTNQTSSFVRYGATAGAFLDVNDRRVVSLAVTAAFVDPMGDAAIPFTELVTLGGSEAMRGLYAGRLHDRSAALLQLGYRWPIWIWLDGALRTELGNVFGEHLAGFRVERLRWSGAFGVESTGTPDNSFQFMIGIGSETFESGGKIDSWRFALGTTSGF